MSYEYMCTLKSQRLSQENLNRELEILPQVLEDKTFIQFGVEPEELDAATAKFDLENDQEFVVVESEFEEKVQRLRL